MKSAVLALTLCASALAAPKVTLAQPGTAAAADPTNARGDYRKALAEMDKGNWQAAHDLLTHLFKRSPTFDVAASLGEAASQLKQYDRAAQHLAYALKNVPPKEKAETSARIRAGLNDVLVHVGALRLSVNRDEAQVFVDGRQVGSYPALSDVYLTPGKHAVEARSGTDSARREVVAVAGTSSALTLDITSNPPGIESGLSMPQPAAQAEPPLAEPTVVDEPDNRIRNFALVSGGSLAVAGLAVGIGFAVAASNAKGDANDYRARFPNNACTTGTATDADCRALAEAVSRQQDHSTLANVGWVVGAIGAATVGVALLWPREEPNRKTASSPELALGWQGNRLLLRGTF